jgi:hypothetical protein
MLQKKQQQIHRDAGFVSDKVKYFGNLYNTNTNKITVNVSIVNCVMAKSGAL